MKNKRHKQNKNNEPKKPNYALRCILFAGALALAGAGVDAAAHDVVKAASTVSHEGVLALAGAGVDAAAHGVVKAASTVSHEITNANNGVSTLTPDQKKNLTMQ